MTYIHKVYYSMPIGKPVKAGDIADIIDRQAREIRNSGTKDVPEWYREFHSEVGDECIYHISKCFKEMAKFGYIRWKVEEVKHPPVAVPAHWSRSGERKVWCKAEVLPRCTEKVFYAIRTK